MGLRASALIVAERGMKSGAGNSHLSPSSAPLLPPHKEGSGEGGIHSMTGREAAATCSSVATTARCGGGAGRALTLTKRLRVVPPTSALRGRLLVAPSRAAACISAAAAAARH
ncbi:unnamed protein product [Lampetra fluviatilis]